MYDWILVDWQIFIFSWSWKTKTMSNRWTWLYWAVGTVRSVCYSI